MTDDDQITTEKRPQPGIQDEASAGALPRVEFEDEEWADQLDNALWAARIGLAGEALADAFGIRAAQLTALADRLRAGGLAAGRSSAPAPSPTFVRALELRLVEAFEEQSASNPVSRLQPRAEPGRNLWAVLINWLAQPSPLLGRLGRVGGFAAVTCLAFVLASGAILMGTRGLAQPTTIPTVAAATFTATAATPVAERTSSPVHGNTQVDAPLAATAIPRRGSMQIPGTSASRRSVGPYSDAPADAAQATVPQPTSARDDGRIAHDLMPATIGSTLATLALRERSRAAIELHIEPQLDQTHPPIGPDEQANGSSFRAPSAAAPAAEHPVLLTDARFYGKNTPVRQSKYVSTRVPRITTAPFG